MYMYLQLVDFGGHFFRSGPLELWRARVGFQQCVRNMLPRSAMSKNRRNCTYSQRQSQGFFYASSPIKPQRFQREYHKGPKHGARYLRTARKNEKNIGGSRTEKRAFQHPLCIEAVVTIAEVVVGPSGEDRPADFQVIASRLSAISVEMVK